MSTDTLDLAPAAILARAADVIDRNGHARGEFYNASAERLISDSPVCALGAIAVAADLYPDAWTTDSQIMTELRPAENAVNMLADSLGLASEDVVVVIGHWNDYLDAATVTAALRAAASEASS